MRIDLLVKQTSTGVQSDAFYMRSKRTVNGSAELERIKGTLFASGTFGGSTVKVQVYDGAVWIDVSGASLTAAGHKDVDIDAYAVRVDMSAGAGPYSVDACFITPFVMTKNT